VEAETKGLEMEAEDKKHCQRGEQLGWIHREFEEC